MKNVLKVLGFGILIMFCFPVIFVLCSVVQMV